MGSRSRDLNNRDKRYSSKAEPTGAASILSWGDQLILEPVLDDERRGQIDLAPPASPTTGDRYIVPPDATGAWVGYWGNIAQWSGSAWTFTIPPIGSRVYSRKRNEYLTFVTTEGYLILPSIVDDIIPLVDPGPSIPSEHWIPDSLSMTFHQSYQGVIEDISLPITYSSAAYERRIVIAGSPAPWDTYINYIATRMAWAQTGRNHNWIVHQPKTGEICWLNNPGAFYYYNGTNWVPLGSDISLNELSDVTLTGPVAGEVLGYNGTIWVNTAAGGAHAFGSHSNANANLTTPGAGLDQYVVAWDNASTSFKLILNTAVAGPHALDSHTDTDLGSPGAPENGYFVGWNNATTKYELLPPASATSHLLLSATHSDSTVTGSVANGDMVLRVGGNWTNKPATIENLSDTTFTALTNGDVIYRSAGTWVNASFASLSAAHPLGSHSDVDLATGKVIGSQIKWNGSQWVIINPVLNDLFDVDTTGAAAGNGLIFNGAGWVPGSPAASVSAQYLIVHGNGNPTITGSGLSQLGARGLFMNNTFATPRFQATVNGVFLVTVTSTNSGSVFVTKNGVVYSNATAYGCTTVIGLTIGEYFGVDTTNPGGSGGIWNIAAVKVGEL